MHSLTQQELRKICTRGEVEFAFEEGSGACVGTRGKSRPRSREAKAWVGNAQIRI